MSTTRPSTRRGDTFDERLARGLRVRFPDQLGSIGDASLVVKTVEDALAAGGGTNSTSSGANAKPSRRGGAGAATTTTTPKKTQPMKSISTPLQKIVGAAEMSRGDVTKAVWNYAKTNGLNTGKIISLDSNLKGVFGNRGSIDGFKDMQKLLTPHLT